MRAIWLIATNYVREQRWVILLFVAWVFLFSGALFFFGGNHGTAEDYEDAFHDQSIGCILYSLLGGVSAIHSDIRSRRIVAVLAKGIYRAQYVAGLAAGCGLVSGVYVACLLLNFTVVLEASRIPHASLMAALGNVWLASVLAATMALVFGARLHPAIASIGAGIVIAVPWRVSVKFGEAALLWMGSDHISLWLARYSLRAGWQGGYEGTAIAALQTALCIWLAARLFAKRDVTAAVE